MSQDREVHPTSAATLGFVEGDLNVGKDAIIKGEGMPPNVSVSGTVRCSGDCTFECRLHARNLEARGNVDIRGDLEVEERVRVRSASFGGGGLLSVEGNMRARNLYGERIHIESGCRIEGEVQYTTSLEARTGVSLARSPVKVEKLPP